jgi:tRNA G18 (ribose-2'-O)-methylase SpoU
MSRPSWYRRKYEKELIRSRLHAPGRYAYVIVLDHLKPGFNVGKILRSANAFGAREVHLVGIPMFDPSPARGALKHTRTRSFATIAESFAALEAEGYTLYALHSAGAATLGTERFPDKTAFIAGHEEFGLSFDPQVFPQVRLLRIPQHGLVESLNVSIATSLAAFEYTRQRST